MTFAAAFTIVVILIALVAMVLDLASPDTSLLTALLALVATGVVPLSDALAGFANPGMLTVATLYVVAAGLQTTGVVSAVALGILGRTSSVRGALARLVPATLFGSAIVNNTAVVAALLPGVRDWSGRRGIPPSKLLLALSYASILGGLCTLVGTSTNLIVAGLVSDQVDKVPGLEVPGMFSITPLGGTAALLGGLVMVIAGPVLFPTRGEDDDEVTVRTPLSAVLLVQGSLDDATLDEAGLLRQTGFFIAAIHRGSQVLRALTPESRLRSGDRLVVVGDVHAIAELRRTPGLDTPRVPTDEHEDRVLVQVVVSRRSSLVGRCLRDVAFVETYRAVVLAITHDTTHPLKLGDHVFQPGDLLLLEAVPRFLDERRALRDFAIVSALEQGPPRRKRAPQAVAVLAAFVILLGLGVPSVLAGALAASGMIATRCVTMYEARHSLDLRVLVAIAAAIGIGAALQTTGLDAWLASGILQAGVRDPRLAVLVVYVVTAAVTETVTNNAAAVLALPVALSLSAQLDVSPMPFVYTVTVAASASFLSPIGYQTNLMVYGPGEYHFSDYLRSGAALSLLVAATTVLLAPVLWPF